MKRSVVAVAGLLWGLSCGAAAGETGSFEAGVTEQNLQWVAKGDLNAQLAVIDALADAGAQWVRLSLRKPFAPLLAHIQRANARGVRVLVVLENGEPAWYPEGTARRPGNHGRGGCAWDCHPLSEMDLQLGEACLREFFELLKAEGAVIGALEMFNEINWNAFNGDLPLVEGGLWIDEDTPWDDPVFVKYRAGVENVGKLTRSAARLNREYFDGLVRIITCGQVGGIYEWKANPRIAAWFAKVQGALVSHDLTLQLLAGKHPRQTGAPDYLEDAGGIGLHIYPEPHAPDLRGVIDLHLDPVRRLGGRAKTLPFWITETGYVRGDFTDDEARLEEFHRYFRALDKCGDGGIAAVLVFNFSAQQVDADRYGLWENGALLPAGGILRKWGR